MRLAFLAALILAAIGPRPAAAVSTLVSAAGLLGMDSHSVLESVQGSRLDTTRDGIAVVLEVQYPKCREVLRFHFDGNDSLDAIESSVHYDNWLERACAAEVREGRSIEWSCAPVLAGLKGLVCTPGVDQEGSHGSLRMTVSAESSKRSAEIAAAFKRMGEAAALAGFPSANGLKIP